MAGDFYLLNREVLTCIFVPLCLTDDVYGTTGVSEAIQEPLPANRDILAITLGSPYPLLPPRHDKHDRYVRRPYPPNRESENCISWLSVRMAISRTLRIQSAWKRISACRWRRSQSLYQALCLFSEPTALQAQATQQKDLGCPSERPRLEIGGALYGLRCPWQYKYDQISRRILSGNGEDLCRVSRYDICGSSTARMRIPMRLGFMNGLD